MPKLLLFFSCIGGLGGKEIQVMSLASDFLPIGAAPVSSRPREQSDKDLNVCGSRTVPILARSYTSHCLEPGQGWMI